MKYLFIVFFLTRTSVFFTQGNQLDSLIKILNNPLSDSIRSTVLSQITETAPEGLWQKYNAKLLAISRKNMKLGSIGNKLMYKNFYAVALSNSGIDYLNRGETDMAIKVYTEAIKVYESAGNIAGVGKAYNGLALVYDNQENVKEALNCYTNALRAAEKAGEEDTKAMALINLGALCEKQGDYEVALNHYKNAHKIYDRTKTKMGLIAVYTHYGTIYKYMGKLEEAKKMFLQSITMLEEIGADPAIISLQTSNLGNVYFLEGNMSEALKYLKKTEKYINMTEDEKGKAGFYVNLASFYLKNNDIKNATLYAERSFGLAKLMKFPALVGSGAKLLFQIYKQKGNHEKAFNMFTLYMNFKDSARNKETKKASIESQLKYEYEKKVVIDSLRSSEEKKIFELKLKKEKSNRMYLFIILGLTLVFGVFMLNRFKKTNQQKNLIEQQKQMVEEEKFKVDEKQKELLDSINYAKRIQNSFLPAEKHIATVLQRLKKT